MKLRAPLSSCLALLLSACMTVGPDYHQPEEAKINDPAAQQPFQGARQDGVSPDEAPSAWWKLYDDEQLNRLVEDALKANTELRVVAANLERSEALAMEAEGAREVKAGANLGIQRAQLSGESFAQTHALPVFNLIDAGIRLGYQLDVFGGLKRAIEAADANVEASRAALDLARITIVGDLVLAYTDACAAGEELEVAEHTLKVQEAQHEAVARLVAGGRRNAVEVPRAKTLVEQTRAAIPGHIARRRVALYRLAVLTGRAPGDYPREVENCHRLPELKQPIPIGDGASLLRRRPDIRQAERSLASATARIGVATAALYPSISIGTSIGITGLMEHFNQDRTQRWNYGTLISWELPDEESKARVRQANANAAGLLARFDTTVLNALHDVESALAVLARDMDRHTSLTKARDQAAEANRQIEALYKAGRMSYIDFLDSQRSLASADTVLSASGATVAADRVKLFLALGGGWQDMAAKEAEERTKKD